MWWYWYIYFDGSQYKDIFLLHEILNDKFWCVTCYEIVVRIIYLKGLFPHPNVSEFHLLSYLTPSPLLLFSPYRYIRGIIEVETLRRQQLWTIIWTYEDFIIIVFYGIKHYIGELFWGCFVFGGLEFWHL